MREYIYDGDNNRIAMLFKQWNTPDSKYDWSKMINFHRDEDLTAIAIHFDGEENVAGSTGYRYDDNGRIISESYYDAENDEIGYMAYKYLDLEK